MTGLLVATTNRHKLAEIRHLLAALPVHLVGLEALGGVEEPDETGTTFDQNARLKALYYDHAAAPLRRHGGPLHGIPLTVAEDSGLVIDALDGEPGVRSARFLRADATYPERFAEIFRRLDAQPDAPRTARFVCALAVVRDGRVLYETRGVIRGEIAREARGAAGFGYDPIFYYPPYQATLAEVPQASKLDVAHRGQAFRAFAGWLRESGK